MAIDTASKRFSAITLAAPWRGLNYFPTGTVSPAERLAVAGYYSGIAAAGGVIAGTLAVTLDDATLAGTGTLAIKGAVAVTLADVTLAATGTLAIKAAVSSTLDDVTLAATGTLAIKGTLAVTLDALTMTAEGGVVSPPIGGDLGVTLEAATLAATGTLAIKGAVDATLGDATLAASGTVDIAGTVAATLDDATLAATGTVAIKGTLAITLEALTLEASGGNASTPIAGTLAVTLDDVTLVATGREVLPVPDQTGGSSGGWAKKRTRAKAKTSLDWQKPKLPEIQPPPPITATLAITLDDVTMQARGELTQRARVAITLDDAIAEIKADVYWRPLDDDDQLVLLAIMDFEMSRRA